MRFALTHKTTAVVLAMVSAYPVLVSREVGAVLWVLLPIVMVVGWFLEPPLTRSLKYRRFVSAAVVVVLILQLARIVSGTQIARAGLEFALVLLAAKLLSRGNANDYYQIVILCFLNIIGAAVTTDDLEYGVCFIIFVALSPPVLALSYLRQEMERRFGPVAQTDGSEILERLLRSRRVISPRFFWGTSLLSIPILIITAILFVIFPRIGLGFLGRVPNAKATVGFGDTVALGDFDISLLSDRVMVRLEPLHKKNSDEEYLPIKLRGAIFDKYAKNSWLKSKKVRWKPVRRDGNYYFIGSKHIPGIHTGYRIFLEPMDPCILLIPEGTGSLALDDVISRGKRAYRTIERDEMGVIRYSDDAHVGLRYDVRLTGDPPIGDTPRDNLAYLELPENSGRLIALAAKLAGSADSSYDKASNIVQGLKYGYDYSLALSSDHRNKEADNPLDRFLFSRKTGTCEHFATALALLLRAQNIPSRLITGFSGARWNSIGGYWAVSQNFAHSWVEAYLGGKWVTLDATPAADNNVLMKRPSTWAMVLDSIRKIWQDRVVGYDIASQSKLAIGLWRAWIRRFGGRNGVPSLPYKLPLFIFALVTVGGGLIIFAYRRGYLSSSRANRRPAGSPKKHREATRLYARLDSKLTRLGYPRPRMRTPIEHAEIIEKTDAALAAIVIDITTRYNEVWFGDQDFGPDELKTLKNAIKRIGLKATPQS